MQIHVDKVAATQDGLFIGLRLEYTKNGPIRFAQVSLEDDVLDWEALQGLAVWVVRQTNRHLDRERELLEEQPALFDS